MNGTRKSYETNRLWLKPTSRNDASFICELLNTPGYLRFVGDRKVRTKQEAEQYIANRLLPQQERLGYSSFTVITKNDGIKIGTCGLFDREGLEGIDIGFAFLPAYEGKGYGFEAASCILKLAFTEYSLPFVQGITATDNVASQKLLEKIGLTCIGTTRLPNDDAELLLYSLQRQQWNKRL